MQQCWVDLESVYLQNISHPLNFLVIGAVSRYSAEKINYQ